MQSKDKRAETRIVHSGRHPEEWAGIVNPPIYRASTVLAPTVAALREKSARSARDERGIYYGRNGTPTTRSFEEAIADLEGGYRTLVYPCGLAACTGAMLSYLGAGDHVLITDNVYSPVRRFADRLLARYGVEVTYFDPLMGRGIAALFRPNTRLVYTEAPGSHTFEMTDVPALAAIAHERGAVVAMDNTWATPHYFRAFDHGVDISIQAATKYIVAHSDAMLGTVTTTEKAWGNLRDTHVQMGFAASPDDIFLGLRGLRTLHVRLPRHWENGVQLAQWLQRQPEVERVLHPALPGDPGHAIWKRDFKGASGLFGVMLKAGVTQVAFESLIDGLELYGIGASWGGFESLVLPTDVAKNRTATKWAPPGPVFRIHAGLEHIDDLIADMNEGFSRLRKALG
ncbi:MAG: cystathionine beta-lyase [Burkholderiales bacterium]